MQFNDVADFWNMGGYGLYVWLAFGSGFASLGFLWLATWQQKRRLFANVLTEQARLERIKQANAAPAEQPH